MGKISERAIEHEYRDRENKYQSEDNYRKKQIISEIQKLNPNIDYRGFGLFTARELKRILKRELLKREGDLLLGKKDINDFDNSYESEKNQGRK